MSRTRNTRILRSATAMSALLLLTGGLTMAGTLPAAAAICATTVPGDINSDGHADVVTSDSGPTGEFEGRVHVLYGQSSGLVADPVGTAPNDQLFTQDSPGVPGTAAPDNDFGIHALGDFNNDGCSDLAVGAWGEDHSLGSVTILYGTPTGLTTTGAQALTVSSVFGFSPVPAAYGFGWSLVVSDLNTDGIDDLAVGAPFSAVDGHDDAGAVAVLFGDGAGLNNGSTAALWLTQDTQTIPGTAEAGDSFGGTLAAGDFDGDGTQELAVASVRDSATGENGTGAVHTLQLAPGAKAVLRSTYLSQNTPGVPGSDEQYDDFGWGLAAGDINGDGRDDLAIGVPGENGTAKPTEEDPYPGKGDVAVLLGSKTGITGTGSRRWSQDTPGIPGVAQNGDRFGEYLTIAPLTSGTYDDLVIGSSYDAVGTAGRAGSATVLFGRSTGLTTTGAIRLHQDVAGMPGTAEPGDGFGARVTASFVQDSDIANLIIGAPGEDVGGVQDAGQLHQLVVGASGPKAAGSRVFHLDSPGVQGVARTGSYFGL